MTAREISLYCGTAFWLLLAALNVDNADWCRFYCGCAVGYFLAANIIGTIHDTGR